MSKSRILIPTTEEGHRSISNALEEILKDKYEVLQYTNSYIKSLLDVYRYVYQVLPQAIAIPYYIGQAHNIINITQKEIHKKNANNMRKIIKDFNPDLIIPSYWAYIYTLNQIQFQYKFKQLNVVADPRSPHPVTFNPKCQNLIFDIKTNIRAQTPPDHITISGWFTRSKFYQPLSFSKKSQILSSLGFKKNIPTFLVCGGSEGTNSIIKILPSFINAPKPTQLLIICGNNKALKNMISMFQNSINDLGLNKKSLLNLKVIGFTRKMNHYMQISDLVIGKAGPNLIFESVASGKPFFAISNLSGQEEGNLNIIKDYNIGIVQKNVIKSNKQITQIIKNPSLLDQYQSGIQKLRNHNLKSQQILLDKVKEALNTNS